MRSLALAIVAALYATTVQCQEPTATASARTGLVPGDRYFEGSVGYSWFSPRGSDWGSITGRRVLLTGIRSEWVLEASGPFAIASTMELVPLAVVQRAGGDGLRCWFQGGQKVCGQETSTPIAVGTGGMPLGLKLYLDRLGSTRVFAAGAVGALVFSSDVPVDGSRRFNFAFEYGGGMEFFARDDRAVVLGYKFHHVSNAMTAKINPGLDANVLYAGLRKYRAR